jgi:hypothetical protein
MNRNVEIVRHRGIGGESYRQIGRRYGISAERVRQIVLKAQQQSRHPLSWLSRRARHVLASPSGCPAPHFSRRLMFPPIMSPEQLAVATFDLPALRQITGCGIKTAREILNARVYLHTKCSVSPPNLVPDGENMPERSVDWRAVLEAGDQLADAARQAATERIAVEVLLAAVDRWERLRQAMREE